MDMESQDIIHVAVAPPAAPDSDLVRAAASIIDKSPSTTRLLLAGRIPRLVAHYRSLASAETAASALRHLGLRAIALRDAELLRPSQTFKAHALQFGDTDIEFWDKVGRSIRIAPGEASLIVRGTMEIREDREKTTTKTKLNVPATLLTGGIPIRRKITEKTVETITETEAFVRVYSKSYEDASVEIRQHEFDYSCLGSEMAPASLINFSRLVARIRDTFPQATYDDRLTKAFVVDLPSANPWEKIDASCNLIHFFENPSVGIESHAGDRTGKGQPRERQS
jgi:hypothetical protein